MAKDGGDVIASWALHIHETGIGALQQALLCFLFSFGEGYRRSFGRGMFSWGGCHCRKAFFHFFFFFFWMGTSFEAFIELVTVLLLLFYVGP